VEQAFRPASTTQQETGFSRRGKVSHQERSISGYGFSHTTPDDKDNKKDGSAAA